MKDKVYIFGHKNPDTDSVCAAITLSYLQNELGLNTEPRILSHINDETKYILKKLKVQIPEILDNVKLQIKDVNYHNDFYIKDNDSVYNAFYKMTEHNMSTIPIIDDNKKFIGIFSMKDIAKKEILEDNRELKTKYDYILKVVNGIEVLKYNDEISGTLTNISLRSTTFYNNDLLDSNTILVLGDRHSIIEDAINKRVKLIIITYNNKIKEEHLELAKKNKINIIYTKLTTYETLQKISFSSYIKDYRYTKDIVCVNEELEITELNDVINKTKHSYYPVVNNKKECLGLLKLSDLRDNTPKKVILVDHNEISQSVDGLEEAEIISIVDHHKLGNLGTNIPINFRNMTVGSTCTIIYNLFKENKVKLNEQMASLLLAGLISDTLLLKSPTTTKIDEQVFKELIKITNIDAEKFAIGMFKANDIANSKSLKEIIYTDFKSFNINNKNVAISQITTLNSKAILKQKTSYIKYLNKECFNRDYDIMILSIIDIFKNGSYILFNTSSKDIINNAFNDNIEEGTFLNGIISRKKQLLPLIISAIH